jgi:hypothetical protein
MPPWYALMNRLKKAPTFPLLIGSLLHRALLPSSDPYEAGLALLHDMAMNPYLDRECQCVSVRTCDDLKVPVFRLRPRKSIYSEGNFPSVFPTSDADGVRLRFSDDVIPRKVTNLREAYEEFYNHFKFKHFKAMKDGRFSRDDRTWVDHSQCPDFQRALAVLTEVADRIVLVPGSLQP